MPVLNDPRWEALAQNIALGMSKAQAYREAGYEASNARSQSVNVNRLLKKHPEILARVEELRQHINIMQAEREQKAAKALCREVINKQWLIDRCIENFKRAMQAIPVLDPNGIPTGEYRYDGAVANKCLEMLGREHSTFIDRKIVTLKKSVEDLTDEEIESIIGDIDARIHQSAEIKNSTHH